MVYEDENEPTNLSVGGEDEAVALENATVCHMWCSRCSKTFLTITIHITYGMHLTNRQSTSYGENLKSYWAKEKGLATAWGSFLFFTTGLCIHC